MDRFKVTRSIRAQGWRLGIIMGLMVLFLMVLIGELPGRTAVYADPGTLYVDGATGQDISGCGTAALPCQTISYAFNNQAIDGDTSRVAQGTYVENLVLNKQVTLEGGYTVSGTVWLPVTGETIVDGSGNPATVVHFGAGSSGAVLDRFTITGGDASAGGGVRVANNGLAIIANAVITGNQATDGGGMRVENGSSALVTATTVISNSAGWGGGILVDLGASASIVGSIIQDNTASDTGGGVDAWWPEHDSHHLAEHRRQQYRWRGRGWYSRHGERDRIPH